MSPITIILAVLVAAEFCFIFVDGKVFYRRCGKDSFQVHGNDFFLTRDKE